VHHYHSHVVCVCLCLTVIAAGELCLVDELAEETALLKTVQSKDAAAVTSPVAVSETQSRSLTPHDAIEPSKCLILHEIL